MVSTPAPRSLRHIRAGWCGSSGYIDIIANGIPFKENHIKKHHQ